jgi:hypothetical protein
LVRKLEEADPQFVEEFNAALAATAHQPWIISHAPLIIHYLLFCTFPEFSH